MNVNLNHFDFEFLSHVLTPPGLARVRNKLELKEFKRGQKVYTPGETPAGVYFIIKGLIGLVIGTTAGKEHLVRLFGKEQFFGHRSIIANEEYHGSTVALEQTNLVFLPKASFKTILMDFPEILHMISVTMAQELRRCEIKFATHNDQDVTLRVIATITYLLALHPDHCWTRKEIAEFCGSTAPTVIKVLAKLEQAGLISQDGRQIRILDLEQLELLLTYPDKKNIVDDVGEHRLI